MHSICRRPRAHAFAHVQGEANMQMVSLRGIHYILHPAWSTVETFASVLPFPDYHWDQIEAARIAGAFVAAFVAGPKLACWALLDWIFVVQAHVHVYICNVV